MCDQSPITVVDHLLCNRRQIGLDVSSDNAANAATTQTTYLTLLLAKRYQTKVPGIGARRLRPVRQGFARANQYPNCLALEQIGGKVLQLLRSLHLI